MGSDNMVKIFDTTLRDGEQAPGCGMTAEAQARIFDPLYTTKERGKGTGLGLAVVNQVMQEHDGVIEVESAPERGSRFRLLFPTLASTHIAAQDDQLSQTAPI